MSAEPARAMPRAYDVERVRRDFPILWREVYGKPLVYLDNSASSQVPQIVIDRVRAVNLGPVSEPERLGGGRFEGQPFKWWSTSPEVYTPTTNLIRVPGNGVVPKRFAS